MLIDDVLKELTAHRLLGHDLWARSTVSQLKINERRAVCYDIDCSKIDDHVWDAIVFHHEPALRCLVCKFVWKPGMRKPRVTCQQILDNPKNEKRKDHKINKDVKSRGKQARVAWSG